MSASCCETHMLDKKKKEALFWRNLLGLFFGFLLQIHAIEHVLFSGFLTVPSFLFVSGVLAYIVQKDFTHIADLNLLLRKLFVSTIAAFAVRLFLGVGLYTALASLLAVPVFHLLLKNFSLFVRDVLKAKQPVLVSLFNQLNLAIYSLLSLEWIPSMDAIILLSVFVTWAVSALTIFMPGLSLGEILLHDSLLSISVFNLGRWFRSHWESPKLFHNHIQRIDVLRAATDQMENIKISDLKKGDVIHITDQIPEGLMIPVRLYTDGKITSQAVYRDCATEKIKTLNLAEDESLELESHHKIYKGSFKCQEDYRPLNSKLNKGIKREHELKGEFGTRVFVFLLYLSAVAISLVTGITAGVVLGLQKLCLLLMVCCPCVYIIIKPAVQGKIPDFAAGMDLIMNAVSLPLVNSRISFVFDRTGTLFHEDPNNPDGPYIISDEAKNMLQSLIDKGFDVKILSGHGAGDDWERHLEATKDLLSSLGLKNVHENIIFDRALHGSNSIKSKYIKNLKHYNYFGEKVTLRQRLFGSIQSIFFPRTIFMVGDDLNDEGAMAAADIAIAIGAVDPSHKIAFNDKIANYAHFVTSRTGITRLHLLIPILVSSSRWVRFLTTLSAVIAVSLMTMISGLINIGLVINPAFLCTFTTAYCFLITVFSYSKTLDRLIGLSTTSVPNDFVKGSKAQGKKKFFETFKSPRVFVSGLIHSLWTFFEKLSVNHGKKNFSQDTPKSAPDGRSGCACFAEAFPEVAKHYDQTQGSVSTIPLLSQQILPVTSPLFDSHRTSSEAFSDSREGIIRPLSNPYLSDSVGSPDSEEINSSQPLSSPSSVSSFYGGAPSLST